MPLSKHQQLGHPAPGRIQGAQSAPEIDIVGCVVVGDVSGTKRTVRRDLGSLLILLLLVVGLIFHIQRI